MPERVTKTEKRRGKTKREERKGDGMMLKCHRKRREEERQRLEKTGEEWVRETGVTDRLLKKGKRRKGRLRREGEEGDRKLGRPS